MQGEFLGTGAADFFHPQICREGYCSQVKQISGRSIRNASAFLVNNHCLLDASWTLLPEIKQGKLDLAAVDTILITHGHVDHFAPPVIVTIAKERQQLGLPPLKVFGNRKVTDSLSFYLSHTLNANHRLMNSDLDVPIRVHELKPFEQMEIDELSVIPVPANHGFSYLLADEYPGSDGLEQLWYAQEPLLIKNEDAYNYIIATQQGACMFYGLDSDWPLPETVAEMRKHKFDFMILDGTFAFEEIKRPVGHMNFYTLSELVTILREQKLLIGKAYASHLSLHYTPPYEEAELWLKKQGIVLAFDSLVINSN